MKRIGTRYKKNKLYL